MSDAEDGYTTVYQTTDPAIGELVAELFEREGIDARFHRVSAALIGAGPQIFETRVDVPTELEARARELLADLEYVGASEQEAEPAAPTNLRRPMLAGVAFLVPGGGHFYARRAWTGLVMATAIVCTFFAATGSGARGGTSGGELGFGVFVALFLCDAIGGVLACRAENRDVPRPGQSQQILRGLVLILIALAAGAAFAGAASIPGRLVARRLARFTVTATPTGLTVQNGDPDGRIVTISHLSVRIGNETWARVYEVEGETSLPALGPGQQRTLRFEDVAHACAHVQAVAPDDVGYGSDRCTLVFELDATRPSDGSMLEGEGSCALRWDVGEAGTACEISARQAGWGRRGE